MWRMSNAYKIAYTLHVLCAISTWDLAKFSLAVCLLDDITNFTFGQQSEHRALQRAHTQNTLAATFVGG